VFHGIFGLLIEYGANIFVTTKYNTPRSWVAAYILISGIGLHIACFHL